MYNGRYLGNFVVLAITRSRLLKTVLISLSYYAVCYLCYKYWPIKKTSALLFAAILFFVIPRDVFSQSIVWSAGYANYVPSAIISTLYMVMINNITVSETPKYPKYFVVITLLFGFCGAPFMENIALFNICFVVAVIGYTAIKLKKLMLVIFQHLGISNDVMCAIASALLVVLAFIFIRQNKNKSQKASVLFILLINCVCNAYLVYRTALVYMTVHENSRLYPTVGKFALTIAFVYLTTTLLLPLICVDKGSKFRMLLPIFKYDTKRNESAKIQSDNGENTVVIANLPHPTYI